MFKPGEDSVLQLGTQFLKIVVIVFGIAAAYFMTIQSIKAELSAKAEWVVVETLDKKLASFEVLVKEGLVSREQFHQFSKDIESRLTRIEYYLVPQTGENSGKD
jgi:hypothetical protein